MMSVVSKRVVVIALTFLIAFVLTILPLPSFAIWYRPAWVMLVLIFWLLSVPHLVGVATAWCVGLLLDLLLGAELGIHALFFTGLAYIFLKFHLSLRGMSSGQRLVLIIVLQTLYLAIYYWIADSATLSSNALYWMPILTTTICWPWVSVVLREYQRRFEIH